MNGFVGNAAGLIGNTPLVSLARIAADRGRLVAKAEFLQPGASIKDRPARHAIERARSDGLLQPGGLVVEMTSGNMGAGLAIACAAFGHPFHAFMSHGNSIERVRMLEALGARVTRVPQVDGEPGRVTGADIAAAGAAASAFAVARDGYFVDQFNNPSSVLAHEEGTGPELLQQLGGAPDAFVAIVGSGGTFVGVSRCLKRVSASVRCWAVEPEGARVLAGLPVRNAQHLLQGAGYAMVPPQWQAELADGFLAVTDEEAQAMRQRLGREEGLYVGYSAAANVVAALRLLEGPMQGGTVATVLCDSGLKYGST
jgi:cysteine synthase